MGIRLFLKDIRHPVARVHHFNVHTSTLKHVAYKDDERSSTWRQLCPQSRSRHSSITNSGHYQLWPSGCCRNSILWSNNVHWSCRSPSCPSIIPHQRPSSAYAFDIGHWCGTCTRLQHSCTPSWLRRSTASK